MIMQKIGILGSGMVGKTLGTGFIQHGYDVQIGTRDSSKLDEWKAANPTGKVGDFAQTAQFGEVIILACKGSVAETLLAGVGAENLKGKIIIDATNPIADAPPTNGVLKFFTNLDHSLMETLQTIYPEARFVKAFNSVGASLMVNPKLASAPSMFICGNDQAAKDQVKVYLDQFGWETEDMGSVIAARAIEPLCMLWCIPGFKDNQWSHAFKLLKA
jgi:8-hydroxy-5-deazaflavin:NADPH oxidoreductase